jgi:hypothetical protein
MKIRLYLDEDAMVICWKLSDCVAWMSRPLC